MRSPFYSINAASSIAEDDDDGSGSGGGGGGDCGTNFAVNDDFNK